MIFVDRISVLPLLQLLPQAVLQRIRTRHSLRFRFFSASPGGARLLALFKLLGLMAGEEADYDYIDVRDPGGALAAVRSQQMDPLPLCQAARRAIYEPSPVVARFSRRFDRERLLLYLEKAQEEEIRPTLMRINVVSWFRRKEALGTQSRAVYALPRTHWQPYLQGYAVERGVELRGYRTFNWPRALPWRRLSRLAGPLLRNLVKVPRTGKAKVTLVARTVDRPPFTVATPFSGRGLTLNLSHNSDLIWVPSAGMLPDQLLVYAFRQDEPLDQPMYSDLRDNGIRAVAITKGARGTESMPVWPRWRDVRELLGQLRGEWKFLSSSIVRTLLTRGVDRWVAAKLLNFTAQYHRWRWFFSSFDIKLHVDFAHSYRVRLASDQAIADLGGLSIGCQESYEAFPSIFRAGTVDVHFTFSSAWVESERLSHSVIPHFVSTGYVHDHAFSSVRDKGALVRDELAHHGARFVICYLDENSVDDRRLGPSHAMRAENYRYLLDKILSDTSLGLVLKPKKTTTLRMRLGKVDGLLDEALATGRCYIHEKGSSLRTNAFPCEAGAAADVTIGILSASTAALECALSGTPTLLIDREAVTYHPLYALGEGRVVFREWDSLWAALVAYRRDPNDTPGFGDWSPTISTLDSFQDGRAAERMGQYIHWLCRGLAEGMSREETMESARSKYVAMWGSDKVVDLRNWAGGTAQEAGELQLSR